MRSQMDFLLLNICYKIVGILQGHVKNANLFLIMFSYINN